MVIGESVAAAQDYIDNLAVGQQLVINEIADRIRNADARILDVGQPNKQIPEIFIWRSRDDGTRYSRSKVKYSFISVFIAIPPPILIGLWKFLAGITRYSKSEVGDRGFNQVSASTAGLFRRAPLKTGANGGIAEWRPWSRLAAVPHGPEQRSASFIKIGLEIVSSSGYCTGLQDGNDEYLACIGCPGAPREVAGWPIRGVLIGGCVAFG
jgi:hypothetical protein